MSLSSTNDSPVQLRPCLPLHSPTQVEDFIFSNRIGNRPQNLLVEADQILVNNSLNYCLKHILIITTIVNEDSSAYSASRIGRSHLCVLLRRHIGTIQTVYQWSIFTIHIKRMWHQSKCTRDHPVLRAHLGNPPSAGNPQYVGSIPDCWFNAGQPISKNLFVDSICCGTGFAERAAELLLLGSYSFDPRQIKPDKR